MKLIKRLLASFLLVFILLSAGYSAQISRQHADTITNGNLINASDLSDEFDSEVNESNSQDTRLTTLESHDITFTGVKSFTDTVNINWRINMINHANFARSGDVSGPIEGDIWYNSTSHLPKFYDGTTNQTFATTANLPPILQGYLYGLTLSNDASTPNTDIDTAAGIATDDTGADYLKLASSLVKDVSTSWSAGTGSGCLDTGTIPTSGTVHFYLIKRTDTGVVDELCSVSASSPTMPDNYTEKRRIGSVLTDGSAHILGFIQQGDDFLLKDPILDINATDTSTASTRTLSVPSGINVRAILNVFLSSSSGAGVYLSSLDVNDDSTTVNANVIPTIGSETGTGTRSTVDKSKFGLIPAHKYAAAQSVARRSASLRSAGWTGG